MSLSRIRALVTGRVQGVGYRAWTVREAEKLGLVGWVRNLRNGGVEIVAQGEKERLGLFTAALKEGPKFSSVDAVSLTEELSQETFQAFEIR